MFNRRHFLVRCSALAAGASLSPGIALALPGGLREVSLEHISLRTFQELAGADFLVGSGSRVIPLRLQSVELGRDSTEAGLAERRFREERFSLVFTGPGQSRLEQGTYWFAQPSLGRFAMFIVPVGQAADVVVAYEAVFHRIVPAVQASGSTPVRARDVQPGDSLAAFR